MATANVVTVKYVELKLTPDEVQWLCDMVQNPVRENETEFDRKMRKELWDALHKEETK